MNIYIHKKKCRINKKYHIMEIIKNDNHLIDWIDKNILNYRIYPHKNTENIFTTTYSSEPMIPLGKDAIKYYEFPSSGIYTR